MAKKRARRSGSLRKRGRAIYLRYRPPGQQRQIEEVFPRLNGEKMPAYEKRAQVELDRLTLALASGQRQAPTRRTVEESVESFMAAVSVGLKPRTIEGYNDQFRLYLLPVLGQRTVSSITTEDIRDFQRRLLQSPVDNGQRTMAASTAKVSMSRLRDLIRHALDGEDARQYWGISFDPWPQRRLVWPDHREKPPPRTYTPYSLEEARRYVAATPYERLPHVLCIILLMLRDGEFRGMRWGDLDWDEGTYLVGCQHSRQHGVTTTKTASSQAKVPVPKLVLERLRQHRQRQAQLRLKKGAKWQDHDLIFTTSKGTPLPVWQMTQRWNRQISECAGLRYVSMHTLRKTGASLLENVVGVVRAETQAALRHKRPTMTDRYVEVDMDRRQRHIEALATLLTEDVSLAKTTLDAG